MFGGSVLGENKMWLWFVFVFDAWGGIRRGGCGYVSVVAKTDAWGIGFGSCPRRTLEIGVILICV